MYAIVNISGQQFRVENNRKLYVHRQDANPGDSIEFNEVLLMEEDGKVLIGKPYIDGASVVAKVVEHLKGDKVLVFKKKRRKGYQKLNGHRQFLTRIEVEGIFSTAAPSKKKATPKKKVAKKMDEDGNDAQTDVQTDVKE